MRRTKLTDGISYAMMAVLLATVFWDDFPAIFALHVCMTLFSILFAVEAFRMRDGSARWIAAGVPRQTRLQFSRLMGALYLLNAALWPLGKLLALAVDFDQDFILIAQMIGIVAVALLGFLPLILQTKGRKETGGRCPADVPRSMIREQTEGDGMTEEGPCP